MSDNLSRIIKFAQSTGDKLIVTDPDGNEPVVIMPFEMYEHLIKAGGKDTAVKTATEEASAETVSDELYFDDLALETSYQEPQRVEKAVAESPAAEKAPEAKVEPPTLADKQDEEEPPEEEQFYLEPVQ